MPVRYKVLIITMFAFILSCKNKDGNKVKIAQVYDKYLFFEDIKDIIPEDIDKADSAIIVRNKIDLWVKKQTMLKRAELALTDSQKDIDKIVEDYRASLLIEKYKQEYIKQNIDTSISETEIEKYYNDYPESFKINEEIVKALFFKIPVNSVNLETFRYSYNTNNEENLILLAEENEDIKFYDFSKKWIEVSAVFNLLPNVITNVEVILKLSKKFQTREELFLYFVIFKDFKLKGETIPLELASERIKIILLNKRKTSLISQLEKTIYQSDLKNNNIKIFSK